MKRAAFRCVAAGWIRIKNTGDLRQHSMVASGLLYHVAWEESDMAAINAVRYPICGDRRLLPPLNLNLHLPKAHHHVLGQHLAAVVGVLLTRAAPVTHLRPNNFHHNTGRMKRTRHLRDRRGHGNHFCGHGYICCCRGSLLQRLRYPRGCAIDCPCLFSHRRGQSSNCICHCLGCTSDFCPVLFACAAGKAPTTEEMLDIASANAV
jgi:hypothetical protein